MKKYTLMAGCFGVILAGLILFTPIVKADDDIAVSVATITVPTACSLVGNTSSAHTAEIPAGIDSRGSGYYPDGIGLTTLKAYCNDSNGFSIYAVGYSDDTIGNTYLRDNTLGQTDDILTGTTFSGGTSNWAMKMGVTSGTYTPIIAGSTGDSEKQAGDVDYSNWAAVPSEYARVAYRNSGTDVNNDNIASAEGASVTTTYAAYISPVQKSGTYVGKVKYTLVHPASGTPTQPQTTASGKICYYPNASTYDGTMGCQTVSTSATTAKLFASNFSRAGYGFAGWSDAFDYATNANAHFYGPNEDITFTAGQYTGSNPGLSLYAVWIQSAGSFQDVGKTTTVCNGLTAASVNGNRTLASVSALTDTRDNQTYAIAKLADDNCWMIENLRLDNTATLTLANTNNPLNDGTNATLKHNYTDTQTYNSLSATSSVAYNADTAPDGWCQANSAACDDQSRLRTDNTANRVSYASGATMSTDANLYSYGNYYNWYSATAGRGTYGFSTNNNSTAGDLCPTNWRLPKGGNKTRIVSNDDNEFWNLVVDALNNSTNPANYASSTTPYYNGATEAGPVDALVRTWPNNFLHSGYVNGASLSTRGSYGRYWSSTAYSSNGAYGLYFYSTSVYPGTSGYTKYYGWAIRCMVSSGS